MFEDSSRNQQQKKLSRKKPIRKGSNILEQKKNKTRRGRPKKQTEHQQRDFQIDQEYNETDLCQHLFLDYNNSIGFQKGQIFSQKQRKELKAEHQHKTKNKITWDNSHQWFENEEMEKLSHISKIFVLENKIHSKRCQLLNTTFLEIAEIYPRQVTNEIYTILYHVAYRSSSSQPKKMMKQLTQQILQSSQFIFLTCRFSEKEVFRRQSEFLQGPLNTLLDGLCTHIRNIQKQQEEIGDFS